MEVAVKIKAKKPIFKIYKNGKLNRPKKNAEPVVLPAWKMQYNEAMDFKKTASGGIHSDKFTNDIIFNIMCMSLEKFIYSYLTYNNREATNHSLSNLLDIIIHDLISSYPGVARMRFFLKFEQPCGVSLVGNSIATDDLIVMLNLLNELSTVFSKRMQEHAA